MCEVVQDLGTGRAHAAVSGDEAREDEARKSLVVGAGGGSRPRTRFEPNWILSARPGSRLSGTIGHKRPPLVMIAESDGVASCSLEPMVLDGFEHRTSTVKSLLVRTGGTVGPSIV